MEEGAASGRRLDVAGGEESPGNVRPRRVHMCHHGARRAGAGIEEPTYCEVDRIETVRWSAHALARGLDSQDALEVKEAERPALCQPSRDDPPRRFEREGEHVDRALGRGSFRVAEADPSGPRGELGAREA